MLLVYARTVVTSSIEGLGQDPGDRLKRNRNRRLLHEKPKQERNPSQNDQGGSHERTELVEHCFHQGVASFPAQMSLLKAVAKAALLRNASCPKPSSNLAFSIPLQLT